MYHVEMVDIGKTHHLFELCDRLSLCANNMYNTANFYIRNLMTGLKKAQGQRTQNEEFVIKTVSEAIPPVNVVREAKYRKKAAKVMADKRLSDTEKQEKVSRIKHTQFDMPTAEKWFAGYSLLDAVFKQTDNPDYRACHSHVTQNAISDCCEAWSGYFESLKAFSETSGHTGKPKIPGYRKSGGRSTAVLSNLACRREKKKLIFPGGKKKGMVLDVSNMPRASADKLVEARIVPYFGAYQLQIVTDDGIKEADILPSEEQVISPDGTPAGVMTIDPGLNNFVSIADNKGNTPIVVKGGAVKARNQWFNKRYSFLKSELMKGHDPETYHPETTKQMKRLSRKRDAFLRDTFYKLAHFICRTAEDRGLRYIILGHNKGQKQEIGLGSQTNQAFVAVPFDRFRKILAATARKYGILVILQEESYTSKSSFLDRDPIPVYGEEDADKVKFSGRRIKRGLYKSSDGTVLNADINGSVNTGRKYDERVFPEGNDYEHLSKTVRAMTYRTILEESRHRKKQNKTA